MRLDFVIGAVFIVAILATPMILSARKNARERAGWKRGLGGSLLDPFGEQHFERHKKWWQFWRK